MKSNKEAVKLFERKFRSPNFLGLYVIDTKLLNLTIYTKYGFDIVYRREYYYNIINSKHTTLINN